MDPKHSFLVTLVLILILTFCRTSNGQEQKSVSKKALDDTMEAFWQWRMEESPVFASGVGVHDYDDRIASLSLESFANRKAKVESFVKELMSITSELLEKKDKMNYDVLLGLLKTYLEGHQYIEYTYNAINFLEGVQKGYTSLLAVTPFKNLADYQTFLLRMSAIATEIRETQNLLEAAVKVGKTMHRVSIERVPDQIKSKVEVHPTNYYLYVPFNEILGNITSINSTVREKLRKNAIEIIEKEVFAAFRSLSEYIVQDYLPNTRSGYGVSSLPGGDEYYKAVLKWHLTVDLTPKQVYELGLQEVERIEKNMVKVMESVNFTGSIKQFIANLKTQSRFFLSTEEELLQEYRNIIFNRIKPTLPKLFKDIPNLPLVVEAAESRDSAGGFYYDVSADGSIPGRFVANVYEAEKRPKFDMLALCLHEADPGHHMQVSSMLLADLPKFRKFVDYRNYYAIPYQFLFGTAYTEGWGLYSEYLGRELGLFGDPYELFGRYVSEMFRACRLVVDTGIHAMGWSRDQAITYLADRLTDPMHQIQVEIDRYITWPGQACAYKVGELQILQIRKTAEEILGKDFDVKEFHKLILNSGSLPLNILHETVDDWKQKITSDANKLYSGLCVLFTTVTFYIISNIIVL